MISGEEEVLFKYEDETRYYDWRPARVWLDAETGEVIIRAVGGGQFTVSLPVQQISACEIELEGERSLWGSIMMAGMDGTYGGDVGCLTALLFSPIGLLDYFRNRGVAIPVIKLTQSLPDESGKMQEVVLRLRSKRRGRRGQEETRRLADGVGAYLRQHGYAGPLPDLDSMLPSDARA